MEYEDQFQNTSEMVILNEAQWNTKNPTQPRDRKIYNACASNEKD